MIKTIILDIGKVLVDYDWNEFLDSLFAEEDICKALREAIFGHHVWDELDRGVLSEEELLAKFIQYAPDYAEEIRYFYSKAGEALTIQPYTCDFIKELKARGYQVLYLSNWSQHIIDQKPHLLDFLSLTDGGVFSYQVRMIKPDHKIYRHICEKYNLEISECLFVDDKEANVTAAREVGMDAILYQSYEQMAAEILQRQNS